MTCIQRATAAIAAKRMCRSMVYGNVYVCSCVLVANNATGQTGDNRDTNLCFVFGGVITIVPYDSERSRHQHSHVVLCMYISHTRERTSPYTDEEFACDTHAICMVRKATVELYQLELVMNRRISRWTPSSHTHIRTTLQASGVFKRQK